MKINQRDQKRLRVFGIGCGVILATFLLFVSIWRSIDRQVEKSLVPVDDPKLVLEASPAARIQVHKEEVSEVLPRSAYLPHHPFYMIKMVYERMMLLVTVTPQEREDLYEDYADERMGVSLQLLEKQRGREALEAAAKGYMYTLQATEMVKSNPTVISNDSRQHLVDSLIVYERVMLSLQESVTDRLKPEVGAMVSGLERVYQDLSLKKVEDFPKNQPMPTVTTNPSKPVQEEDIEGYL